MLNCTFEGEMTLVYYFYEEDINGKFKASININYHSNIDSTSRYEEEKTRLLTLLK